MHDPLGLLFASVNVGLTVLVLGMMAYGVNYFKRGLLVKTLKRACLLAVLMFLYFLTEAFVAVDIVPSNTPVDDILGTLFMLSMIYVAYGFINDWRSLASQPTKIDSKTEPTKT
jgi:hypothetical protein